MFPNFRFSKIGNAFKCFLIFLPGRGFSATKNSMAFFKLK